MRWPWTRETRSNSVLADLAMQQALARAEGNAEASAIAAVEIALSLWERALSSGTSDAISRAQLAVVGRSLLVSGNSVWPVTNGRLGGPADTYEVIGDSANPDDWAYIVTQSTPTALRRFTRPASRIAHFRIGCTAREPWQGCSPLANSAATRKILERLEKSMGDEASLPTGQIMPVPDSGDGNESNLTQLRADLAGAAGKIVVGRSTSAGWQDGRAGGTSRDWVPSRIGPEFSPHEGEIRTDVERSILACAGIPTELTHPSHGADAREGWRRFLYATVAPVAQMIESELARVGIPTVIDTSGLGASDLAGRARAYKALRESGMPDAEARRICGF